jgi:hypothetical protein
MVRQRLDHLQGGNLLLLLLWHLPLH